MAQQTVTVTKEILGAFDLPENLPAQPLTGGHINHTFSVIAPDGHWVLQRINRFVFPRPEEIMENILGVTEHVRRYLETHGGDAERGTLSIRKTADGKGFFVDENGEFWRCTRFIDGALTHETATSHRMLKEAGFAFGQFQKMLADYPADTLHEIIPKFHDTTDRYRQLTEAVANDKAGRKAEVAAELQFAAEHEEKAGLLMNLLHEGKLPLRVTHNDTKMSNVLIDIETDEAVCVIDLDTVMPGLTAFDFGDSIRAGASTGAEDETDLSKVHFDLGLYEAYTEGFLSAAGDALTEEELRTLPDGAILMTFECGIRFLADYLNGDVYFRTSHPQQNLDRARNQFHLVREMEAQREEMEQIVRRAAEQKEQ